MEVIIAVAVALVLFAALVVIQGLVGFWVLKRVAKRELRYELQQLDLSSFDMFRNVARRFLR